MRSRGYGAKARSTCSATPRQCRRCCPSAPVRVAESAQREAIDGAGVHWRDVWAETKRSPDELAAAGVRPGTRAVLAANRRVPTRLGADGAFIAAPNLDDRVACAVLILLAESLRDPAGDVELVFTSREETGAMGARYYGRTAEVDRLVAVEVAPTARSTA